MPTVPTVQEGRPTVQSAPASNAFQNVQTSPDTFGAGIGRAVGDTNKAVLGALDTASAIQQKKKAEDDERDAKREFLEYGTDLQKVRAEFLSTEGQNTLDASEEALATADTLGKERLAKLSENKKVHDAVQLAMQRERLQFQKQHDTHLGGQKKVVDDSLHESLITSATNDGIDGFKSFGADVSEFDESSTGEAADAFDESSTGEAADAFDDQVRVNENAIRRMTEDKARRDGEIPDAKVAEAVSTYYDSVVRSAVASGDPTTALRIFNGSREKITGEKGVKLKSFLRDQTTNDVALSMARSIYQGVSHLPIEQRLAAGLKQVLEITEYDKFVSVKTQFESLLKSDATIKSIDTPFQAKETVEALLATGMSHDAAAKELNKTKDPTLRKAQLEFLATSKKVTDAAEKESVEDFVGQIYRMEEDDVGETERLIKKRFKDDPKAQGVALAHLKKLADVDKSLLDTDLPSAADEIKKGIIKKVTDALPEGASNAEQKAAAILEAENIKDPAEKLLVITQLNSFYSSLAGFDKEKAQDAGTELINKISKTEKTQAGITKKVLESTASANTKAAAISQMRSLDIAQRKDEKAAMDRAKAAMSAAIAKGQSPSEFRAESAGNAALYDLATSDGSYLGGAVSAFRLVQEGKEFPFVSDQASVREIADMTPEEIVALDRDRFKGFLNRNDSNKLEARQRAEVSKRKVENARLLGKVSRLVRQFQPTNSKNKTQLSRAELAEVDNFVWQQIDEAQKEGKIVDEQSIREMVIGAFVRVEFDPDDPAFFSLERFFGRGGGAKDVAGTHVRDMTPEELKTLRVDADDFPPDLDGFLEDFVEDWKFKNTGEPTEEDLELLRGEVIKELLRVEER